MRGASVKHMINRTRPNFTGLWQSDAGKASIEAIATREGLSKSGALRLLLAYALPRMPKGWRP